uniref:Uncharacterized protein n=1 Tax=Anguilla anguilla TaxID=7936 RepID=A0A0E9RYX5_ANGAN
MANNITPAIRTFYTKKYS